MINSHNRGRSRVLPLPPLDVRSPISSRSPWSASPVIGAVPSTETIISPISAPDFDSELVRIGRSDHVAEHEHDDDEPGTCVPGNIDCGDKSPTYSDNRYWETSSKPDQDVVVLKSYDIPKGVDPEIVCEKLFIHQFTQDQPEVLSIADYATKGLPRFDLFPVLTNIMHQAFQSAQPCTDQVLEISIQQEGSASTESTALHHSLHQQNCMRFLQRMDHAKMSVGNQTDHKENLICIIPTRVEIIWEMTCRTVKYLGPVWTIYLVILQTQLAAAPVDLPTAAMLAMFYSILFPLVSAAILAPCVHFMHLFLYYHCRMMQYGHFLTFKNRNWWGFFQSSYFIFFITSSIIAVVSSVTIAAARCQLNWSALMGPVLVILLQAGSLIAFYYQIWRIHLQSVSLGEFIGKKEGAELRKQMLSNSVYVDEYQLKSDSLALDWLSSQVTNALPKIEFRSQYCKSKIHKAFRAYLHFQINFRHIGCYTLPRFSMNNYRVPKEFKIKYICFDSDSEKKEPEMWTDADWKPLLDVLNSRFEEFHYSTVDKLNLNSMTRVRNWLSSNFQEKSDRSMARAISRFLQVGFLAVLVIEIAGFVRSFRTDDSSNSC